MNVFLPGTEHEVLKKAGYFLLIFICKIFLAAGYYIIPFDNFECPSVRHPYAHHLAPHYSCPLHNSDTIQDIFIKLSTI